MSFVFVHTPCALQWIEEWQVSRRKYLADFQQASYGISADNHLAALALALSDRRSADSGAAVQLLARLRQQLAHPAKQIFDGMESHISQYTVLVIYY